MSEETLRYLRRHGGLIGVGSKVPLRDRSALSLLYTPGVGQVCLEIVDNPAASFESTCRGNTVAIITDGSAVMGLGNIGPEAALPVMETKSVIFKTFAGVDAFPICLSTQDVDRIVQTVLSLTPTFGGIFLEDISAPRCFAVQDQLKVAANIAVFHDDAHSAAVEVLAGLINALKVVGKKLGEIRVVINGAGSAGIAVADLLLYAGVGDIVLCDRAGAIHKYRAEGMNWAKAKMARRTNLEDRKGSLADMMKQADVFVGLSEGNQVTAEMVSSMAPGAIVFALALPMPEIMPEIAREGGASVVATGRSDFPNQIDTALVFPGFVRGLLDVQARNINNEMLVAAAHAMAGLVSDAELGPDHIVPKVLDFRVPPAVAEAVARSAIETGEARVELEPSQVSARLHEYLREGHFPVSSRPPHKEGEFSLADEAVELHKRFQGVLEIRSKVHTIDHYLFKAFCLPPGSAEPSKEIQKDLTKVYEYTAKGNLVAVVSDGSAVLGFGNIGARAALPVMEGKSILFNTFAGVEAFPICLSTQDPDEIVEIVEYIAPSFGGLNLEDISAPRCFAIEQRLKKELDIPVFHDDQHGTAVVVLAGLVNALKLVGKTLSEVSIVINGAGAAGMAVAKMMLSVGVGSLIICDSTGAIYEGRKKNMNWAKEEMARVTNLDKLNGTLGAAIKGADVFIGVSAANVVSPEMVQSMAKDPVIFAMANPVPEIMPDAAKAAGARVVATGRSDLPNQVNNCLAFPGIFRGALDVRASDINEPMKIAAAHAMSGLVGDKELKEDYVITSAMDLRVSMKVAAAVAKAAIDSGVARAEVKPEDVEERTRRFVYEGQLVGTA